MRGLPWPILSAWWVPPSFLWYALVCRLMSALVLAQWEAVQAMLAEMGPVHGWGLPRLHTVTLQLVWIATNAPRSLHVSQPQLLEKVLAFAQMLVSLMSHGSGVLHAAHLPKGHAKAPKL